MGMEQVESSKRMSMWEIDIGLVSVLVLVS